MGIAAEPARPVEATIVHGTIETVARQRFRNESCQTFHFAGSWGSHCVAEKKGVSPVSRAGYRCCCWLTVTVLSCTGGGRARPPHLFGFRPPLPGFRETFGLFHSSLGCGRRAYESEGPGAPCIGSGGAKSPLALGPNRSLRTTLHVVSPHSREAKFAAWDCKVTPVHCTCQEGNTICCIPSNDGLGAGLGPGFPHC